MAEKKINGRTFKVDALLVTRALALQARLTRAIGPAIGKLPEIISARSGTEAQKAEADSKTIDALAGIFNGMEPDDYVELVKDIVEIAQIQRPSGQYDKVDIDADFFNDLKSLIPVAFFVLQTQFQDFFGGALANGAQKARANA